MSRPRDPWREVQVLLVDGNNLLHALAGSAEPATLRTFLARLRARVPAGIQTQVILDGPPDPGAPQSVRVAAGLGVRHAGRVTADQALVAAVETHSFTARAATFVVTDDIDLQRRVHRLGARTQPAAWLLARLDEAAPQAARPAPGTAIGAGRPPFGAGGAGRGEQAAGRGGEAAGRGGEADSEERTPWRPGRGATRKRGNPRRRRAGPPAPDRG